ncbi:MAG: hypothetical protein DRJ55_05880, partial [Thermoprotei archaeon]
RDEIVSTEEALLHSIYRFWSRYQLNCEASRNFTLLTDDKLEELIIRYGGSYEKLLFNIATNTQTRYYVAVGLYYEDLLKAVNKNLIEDINRRLLYDIRYKVSIEAEITQRLIHQGNLKPPFEIEREHDEPLVFVHPWQEHIFKKITLNQKFRNKYKIIRVYVPEEWSNNIDLIFRTVSEAIIPPKL